MRFLIIFTFFISNVLANEIPNIKNIVINKELKIYNNLTFLNSKEEILELKDYKGKLVMLNFWATWCEPCKEEMPSLDRLQINPLLTNLKVFPINIGREKKNKVNEFFENLNIKNFEPYFDPPITLAKKFALRGLPTSILLNKNGQEFARIIGSIDFDDQTFTDWLKTYN